jgi:putative tryptophan/tyrosine transport system substrate-binding protein
MMADILPTDRSQFGTLSNRSCLARNRMRFDQLRRRDLIALLGCAAIARPRQARAQSVDELFRVGYIGTSRGGPLGAAVYQAFLEEMQTFGFRAGQNLVVEFRPLEQDLPALSAAASELVRLNANVLLTDGTETALRAAADASQTIPIVMIATNFDPLERRYVKSLARPSGNITGIFLRQTELAEKQTELLSQAVPGAARLGILWDSISADQFSAAERRAKALGLQIQPLKLTDPPYDFVAAFRVLAQASPQMLLVLSSPLFTPSRSQIAELAIQYRLPTMFIFKTYVDAGGLLSYGADYVAMHRQAATHVAKILRGTKVSEIPIEQPNRFELVLNLKTAKALGIDIPQSVVLRADDVIE